VLEDIFRSVEDGEEEGEVDEFFSSAETALCEHVIIPNPFLMEKEPKDTVNSDDSDGIGDEETKTESRGKMLQRHKREIKVPKIRNLLSLVSLLILGF
jgi:hypothetical protein